MLGEMRGPVPPVREAERRRAAEQLAQFCGLEPGASAEACGRVACVYFDDAGRRCSLLAFGIGERLGVNALYWFATHRTPRALDADVDEVLAVRCSSL